MDIGEMRPGSLSKQYNVCGVPGCHCKDEKNPKKHGPYYQLSFTRNKKSSTRFIRRHQVTEVKAQIAQYKKLRSLVDKWIELAMSLAELRLVETRDEARS